jgi:hypothetical protein
MSLDEDYVKGLVREYKKAKEMIDSLEKRNAEMKTKLTEALTTLGTTDNNGHIWLTIDDVEIKRERRVSKVFNASAAEAWAKQNGHWDVVKEVVEVLNEDKILGLAWQNPELQEQIKSFYMEKESWALKV